VECLTSLNEGGLTFIWTPYIQGNVDPRTLEEIRSGNGSFIKMVELAFQAIRGVGQGESASSLLWVTVMGILLTML
jgi:hypothetical protein